MTMAFAILVIYFGTGKYAQFDVEHFDTMQQCAAARAAILADLGEFFFGPLPEDIRCIEVSP